MRRIWIWIGFGVMASGVFSLGGCPGGTGNQRPTANAGPDQSISGGVTVTLSGAASRVQGSVLLFDWVQLGGTPVTLSDPTAEVVTFVAPNVTGSLTFQLTVTDAESDSDADTVTILVTGAVENTAPTVDAGADRSAIINAAVTLGGSATDADGDLLTFAWLQTAGPDVTLTGADTATPSFVAPDSPSSLTFQLTVTDGNLFSSDTVNVTVRAPQLFIANFMSGNSVVAYDVSVPSSLSGNVAPDAVLIGAQTHLVQPSDVVIDRNGALLVSNFALPPSVTVYPSAINLASINGNVAPSRTLTGTATGLTAPTSMAIDRANDLLFIAEASGGTIHVYGNASTAALDGNTPALHTFTSTDIASPRGINFSPSGELYVANFSTTGTVAVFTNTGNLQGQVDATRVIRGPALIGAFDAFVDTQNVLYVVAGATGGNHVVILNNAALLTGTATPTYTLTVPGASNLTSIAVDATGTGYIVDSVAKAVYVYTAIATRNGSVPPDYTLQGANTQLMTPIRVFLQE